MKFTQNAIVENGKKYQVTYSLRENDLTIYEKGYCRLHELKELNVQDDSDAMTDYFCTAHIDLKEGDKYYEEAKKAGLAKQESREKARNKIKLEKAIALEEAEKTMKVNGRTYIVLNEKQNPIFPELTQYQLKKAGRSKKIYVYSTNGKKYVPIYSL